MCQAISLPLIEREREQTRAKREISPPLAFHAYAVAWKPRRS